MKATTKAFLLGGGIGVAAMFFVSIQRYNALLAERDACLTGQEEGMKGTMGQPNPWAICTASVGRQNRRRYERCVQSVKRRIARS